MAAVPPSVAPPPRLRADACPGVLAPHDAADGALARIRLPGGVLTAAAARAVADCAARHGDGAAHLTSRGNLQLRGLRRDDPDALSVLVTAGLVPSRTHERIRNVLASPLSGIAGGLADVRGVAARLDTAICACPALAGLSGRFLFAIDDGRGDVAAEAPDLCWRARTATTGTLLVAGTPVGAVALADAVDVLVSAAEAFPALSSSQWRASEVPDAAARVAAALALPALALPTRALPDAHERHSDATELRDCAVRSPGVGGVLRDDGGRALVVAPVLGELAAADLRLLARLSPQVLVTPWRTIVLPSGGDPEALAAAGFAVDADSPVTLVSACAGSPGCAKSLADVRSHARALTLSAGERTHVVGCGRRCGAPHGAHAELVAQVDGTYATEVVSGDGRYGDHRRSQAPQAPEGTA
ncbi:precorrin-3B synthase [Pseudonocardia sulfidoxydans NBRC 16205]|uniref:Precorrin-3B synthase n=1 Tax=Pseudonocardia sulfidoxydans NBRC 16205 TaxID=1223511 RepID=A0A511DKR2_9PSEU|nr:precorrin-3B synthase [Pseudonocardia sulfidoxydans NBRC 16205]